MKKMNFGSKKSSKGFYIALAVSVIAVGAVTYLTLSRLNAPQTPDASFNTLDNTTEWSIPETSAVEKSQPGVPKDTPQVIVKEEPSQAESSKQTEAVSSAPAEEAANQTDPGLLIMPVTGEILNPYSGGELVKSKTLGEWRTHDGIDIKAEEGTPVKSMGDGKVLDIREDDQWGVVVEMEYPGDITAIYCGMNDDVKVKKGQEVKLGDVIGSVGNSSLVEAAEEMHLHVGVKKDGQWVNPEEVIATVE